MHIFYLVWGGQLISTIGSALTAFAIGLWLFTEGGSVTAFALNNVFFLVPWALLSPIAGAYVDRYNRRRIMIISDTVQALATLVIGLLVFFDLLKVWQVYVAVAIMSSARAFQGPAWSASIPLIVPKSQLGRAAGLGRLGEGIGRVLAPALGGVLILSIGLAGVVVIDFATFLVAVGTLLLVHIPDPPRETEAKAEQKCILQDVVFGLRYLYSRTGLFLLVVIVSLRNLFQNFASVLTVPMALSFTNEAVVGVMFSFGTSGMLLGSLLVSVWGGPRRRIPWLASMLILQGIALGIMGLRPSVVLITAGSFLMTFSFALIATLTGPIYQSKVALDVQGRVFSTATLLALVLEPLGHATVGPLTDTFFEPWMQSGGLLAPLFGPLVGVGPGRGMAVIFILCGSLLVGLGLFSFLQPRVRLLEQELPDVLPDEPQEQHISAKEAQPSH